MKTLKEYIIENNNITISNYINEGFWDGIKNFWNWLTNSNDKKDYDKDGYYRPNIDYSEIDTKSFLFSKLNDAEKLQDLYNKYFSKDNKLNKNCKEYKFDLPRLDNDKKLSKDKLEYYAIVYKNEKSKKEKLVGLIILAQYDDKTYITRITIIDWFLYHINDIISKMIKDIHIEKHVIFIANFSQKLNFLEQQNYNYNNKYNVYEKTY